METGNLEESLDHKMLNKMQRQSHLDNTVALDSLESLSIYFQHDLFRCYLGNDYKALLFNIQLGYI